MKEKRGGGCLCGKIRYEAIGNPKIVGACHCRYCQLRSGSAFGLLVYFDENKVSVTSGKCKEYRFKSESGTYWSNKFCSDCGTTVIWILEVFEGLTGIAGGTFDPPTFWFDVKAEVFTRSKAHFVGEITAEHHTSTYQFYKPKITEQGRLIWNSDEKNRMDS